MPRSSRRKSTPVSPAKVRTETTSPRQTRKATRTRAREPSVTAGAKKSSVDRTLGAVQEEGDSVPIRDPPATHQTSSLRGNLSNAQDAQHLGASPRVHSIRAAVYNDIAPTEVRLEQAIKCLTELNFRADEVLSQIDLYAVPQLLDRLGERQSLAWSDFSEDATRLERQRLHYCTDTDFLQVDELVAQLAAHGLPTTGAESVYMKANLALFFYRLIEAHPVELHNLLITLSSLQTFPEIFCSTTRPGTIGSSSYDEGFQHQTISLGLDILTQTFVFRLKRSSRDKKFDYAATLKDVFSENGANIRDVSLGSSSRCDVVAYNKLAKEVMSEIKRTIPKGAGTVHNSAELDKAYPSSEFMARALAWVQLRAEQLNHDMQRAGGVRAIRHGLQQSDVQPSPAAKHKRPRTSRADEDFAGKVSFLKDVDDDLNAGEADSQQDEGHEDGQQGTVDVGAGVEAERAEEINVPSGSNRVLREITPGAVPESPQVHSRYQDSSQRQEHDQSNLMNDDEPAEVETPNTAPSPSIHSVIKPTAATTTVLRNLQRQVKEGNKENSPPARQINSTGQQSAAPRTTSAAPPETRTLDKGKRRREDDDIEDSEDSEDDFESDRRHAKHPRPAVGRKPASTRANKTTTSTAYLADTVENNDHPPSRITNQPPSSTQPPPHRSTSSQPPPHHRIPSSTAPPPSSYEAYQHAHRHARSNTALATSLAPTPYPRPPQTRRAWTSPEIERLLSLMRQYGCAWSTIKKADDRMTDPQLSERTQVQLKDKARNMKLDFLKAEVELPVELAGVTISRAHKEMLRGMNIAFPGEENEE